VIDRQTDGRCRTSVTIVCISCVRCSLKTNCIYICCHCVVWTVGTVRRYRILSSFSVSWPWSVSQRGDLHGSARFGYWALSIHWPAHHSRRSITVAASAAAPPTPGTHLTQLRFFQSISIDAQRQREEDAAYRTDRRWARTATKSAQWSSSRVVSLSHCRATNGERLEYRLFCWCRISGDKAINVLSLLNKPQPPNPQEYVRAIDTTLDNNLNRTVSE